MEAVVEEKFEYLESVLGQFIVSTGTSLRRLERNISVFSREMREFKDEMRDFKDEMREFKEESREDRKNMNKEMREFKEESRADRKSTNKEMREFKEEPRADRKSMNKEMREFKEEARADRKSMNKKWGELADKMGTVVEDIVAPSLDGIARKYFKVDEFDFFAVRLRKRNNTGTVRREFDVVAESKYYFFVVETKATATTEYIQKFIEFVPELKSWFPDAEEKKIIPVFASLYLSYESIQYLTNNKVFAMAMNDNDMDIFNPQLLESFLVSQK